MTIYEAAKLAKKLMIAHRLVGWSFKFDRAAVRFGRCNYTRKLITLSAPLTEINPDEEVLDTILHEIAHALVGAGHGHDSVWMAKCVEIGARPEATYDSRVTSVPAAWVGICGSGCQAKHRRHKMTSIVRRGTAKCRLCRVVVRWERGG